MATKTDFQTTPFLIYTLTSVAKKKKSSCLDLSCYGKNKKPVL